jgi:hypothetical protein
MQTYRIYWLARRQRAQLKQLVGSSCDQTIIKSWEWLGLRWRNECESDGVVVGVGLKQRDESKRDKRRDAGGCVVVVEVLSDSDHTNDRRRSCTDVWQARTTAIWQPPTSLTDIDRGNRCRIERSATTYT